jgi:hypothetical protein
MERFPQSRNEPLADFVYKKSEEKMTPQEQQLLESLANRVAGTPAPQKDPEAEALIQQRLGSNPDALYILTQTVLIQEIALNQANARLHELQQQQGTQHTSFLGRLFGSPAAPPPFPPQAPPPAYAPPPQYQAPQYAGSPYQQAPPAYAPGGGSSFLRSAAVTATGVAAGALAFEGIESLLHHGGGFGGYGGGYGGGEFLQGAPQETVINNYYDSPGDGGQQAQDASYDDSQQYDDSADTSDSGFDDSSSSGGDDSSSDV